MIKITNALPRFRCLLATGLAAMAMLTSVPLAYADTNYPGVWNSIYPNSGAAGNANLIEIIKIV